MNDIGKKMMHASEEAFVDYAKDRKNTELIRETVSIEGKFNKFRAILMLVSQNLPHRISDKIQNILHVEYDMSALPFDLDVYQDPGRIGKGRQAEVFMLDPHDKNADTYVFKVAIFSDNDTDNLVLQAKKYTEEYQEIAQKYKDIAGLIPWESSFIAKSPRDFSKSIITVQEFEGHNVRGVFDSFSFDELVELMKNDAFLFQSLRDFVQITRTMVDQEGRIIDLLGKNNLLITNSLENERHLKFIDAHDIASDDGTKSYASLMKRLEYLEAVLRYV